MLRLRARGWIPGTFDRHMDNHVQTSSAKRMRLGVGAEDVVEGGVRPHPLLTCCAAAPPPPAALEAPATTGVGRERVLDDERSDDCGVSPQPDDS